MEGITASEIAGLGVGALLLGASIAAPKLDAFISSSQRSSLGMCKKCGDVKALACSRCKGIGFVRDAGPLDFLLPGEVLAQAFGEAAASSSTMVNPEPCKRCGGKGRTECSCSKLSPS